MQSVESLDTLDDQPCDNTAGGICEACRGISVENLVPPFGYRHRSIVDAGAGHDCRICASIYALTYWLDCCKDCPMNLHIDVAVSPLTRQTKIYFNTDCGHDATHEGSQEFRLYLPYQIFTRTGLCTRQASIQKLIRNEGDPAIQYGLPVAKALSDTNSHSTFDFINECIQECNTNHTCLPSSELSTETEDTHPALVHGLIRSEYRQRASEQSHKPSDNPLSNHAIQEAYLGPCRLIDVQPYKQPNGHPDEQSDEQSVSLSSDVRLVQGDGQCHRYITLSHCWGESSNGTDDNNYKYC